MLMWDSVSFFACLGREKVDKPITLERGTIRSPTSAETRLCLGASLQPAGLGGLFSDGSIEEGTQLAAARGVAQFAQSLGFNLADAFAGDGKTLAHFFERMLAAVVQSKPHLNYLLFAGGQRL